MNWNDPLAQAAGFQRRRRAQKRAKSEPTDHLMYLVQAVMVYDVNTADPEHECLAICCNFEDAKAVALRWAANEDVALCGIHDLDTGDVELVKGSWS